MSGRVGVIALRVKDLSCGNVSFRVSVVKTIKMSSISLFTLEHRRLIRDTAHLGPCHEDEDNDCRCCSSSSSSCVSLP